MPTTWSNLQTIRLAIESEADLIGIAVTEAAELILQAAQEPTPLPQYSSPGQWLRRQVYRENTVDRFWFEDARWRGKFSYLTFREELAR